MKTTIGKRAVAVGFVAGVIMMVSPSGSPAHADNSGGKPVDPPLITTVDPATAESGVQTAADYVTAIAETLPGYAGTNINGQVVQVALAGTLPADISSRLQQAGGSYEVQVVQVANSSATLQSVQDKIAADGAYWEALGFPMSSWGPDWSANKVTVTLVAYSPAALPLFQARYGANVVTVNNIGEPRADRAANNRDEDYSPFYGGDGIRVQRTKAKCTAGIPLTWTYNGTSTSYMLTAGHCGNSTDWWIVAGASERSVGNTSLYYFTSNTSYDFETINARTLPYIWRGGPGAYTSGVSAVKGAYLVTESTGANICADGDTTGEVCGVTIRYVCRDQTFSDGKTTKCLTWASKDAVTVVQGGDSGGPIFTIRSDGGLTARGEIIGEGLQNQEVFYTPIRTILNKLTAAIGGSWSVSLA